MQVAGRGRANGRGDVVEQVIELPDSDIAQLDVPQLPAVGADQGAVCGEGPRFPASLDLHEPFLEPVPEGLPTIRRRDSQTASARWFSRSATRSVTAALVRSRTCLRTGLPFSS